MTKSNQPSNFKRTIQRVRMAALLGLALGGSMHANAQASQTSRDSININKEISVSPTKDQPIEDYLADKAVLFMLKTGLDKETFTMPEASSSFYLSFSKNGVVVINRNQNGPSFCGINGPNGFECYIAEGNQVKKTDNKGYEDLLLFALSSPKNLYVATNSPSDNPYTASSSQVNSSQVNSSQVNSSQVNYEFTDQGYSGSYQTDNVDVSSLLPELTRDPKTKEFVCGPLRGNNNTILLAQAQANLTRIVVEDQVCQQLLQKQNLTQQEQNFVNKHTNDLARWGLERGEGGYLQIKDKKSSHNNNGQTHIYHSSIMTQGSNPER